MIKNENELDLLKKVAKLDAPPFLMTRIAAKIRAGNDEKLPVSGLLAGGLAFGLLVFFNIFLVKNDRSAPARPPETLAAKLKIQTSNQFYDE